MNNIFEQRIVEIIKTHEEWYLIKSIPLWIIASVKYQLDFWDWLDFGKNNKN